MRMACVIPPTIGFVNILWLIMIVLAHYVNAGHTTATPAKATSAPTATPLPTTTVTPAPTKPTTTTATKATSASTATPLPTTTAAPAPTKPTTTSKATTAPKATSAPTATPLPTTTATPAPTKPTTTTATKATSASTATPLPTTTAAPAPTKPTTTSAPKTTTVEQSMGHYVLFTLGASTKGTGYILQTFPVWSHIQCAYRCTRNSFCRGVNLVTSLSGFICLLLDSNASTPTSDANTSFWALNTYE